MKKFTLIFAIVFSAFVIASCGSGKKTDNQTDSTSVTMKDKVEQYALVELTADISHLTDKEKQIRTILFESRDE